MNSVVGSTPSNHETRFRRSGRGLGVRTVCNRKPIVSHARLRVALASLVALVALVGRPVSGQDSPPVPHFMETGYIFNRVRFDGSSVHPFEGLLFEAQFAEHFYFRNTHRKTLALVMARRQKVWETGSTVTLTPMVRIRMLNQPSRPVRTPSYMPRVDYWKFWTQRHSNSDTISNYVKEPISMLALNVAIGHHSNGQDGCTFVRGELNDKGCPIPDLPDGDDVNRLNGDFSTNFVRTGVFYKHIRVDGTYQTTSAHGFGVELEYHREEWGPGGISPELHEAYGPTRLRLRYTGDISSWRFRGRYGYAHGAADSVWAHSLELELAWRSVVGDWDAFARAFVGQDYYNLAFLDNRSWLQIGLGKTNAWQEFFPPQLNSIGLP